MADDRLSAPAEAQIDQILEWSQEKFGDLARERYAALLVATMESVAEGPEQGKRCAEALVASGSR